MRYGNTAAASGASGPANCRGGYSEPVLVIYFTAAGLLKPEDKARVRFVGTDYKFKDLRFAMEGFSKYSSLSRIKCRVANRDINVIEIPPNV